MSIMGSVLNKSKKGMVDQKAMIEAINTAFKGLAKTVSEQLELQQKTIKSAENAKKAEKSLTDVYETRTQALRKANVALNEMGRTFEIISFTSLREFRKAGGNAFEYLDLALTSANQQVKFLGFEIATARKVMYGFLPPGMFRLFNKFSTVLRVGAGLTRAFSKEEGKKHTVLTKTGKIMGKLTKSRKQRIADSKLEIRNNLKLLSVSMDLVKNKETGEYEGSDEGTDYTEAISLRMKMEKKADKQRRKAAKTADKQIFKDKIKAMKDFNEATIGAKDREIKTEKNKGKWIHKTLKRNLKMQRDLKNKHRKEQKDKENKHNKEQKARLNKHRKEQKARLNKHNNTQRQLAKAHNKMQFKLSEEHRLSQNALQSKEYDAHKRNKAAALKVEKEFKLNAQKLVAEEFGKDKMATVSKTSGTGKEYRKKVKAKMEELDTGGALAKARKERSKAFKGTKKEFKGKEFKGKKFIKAKELKTKAFTGKKFKKDKKLMGRADDLGKQLKKSGIRVSDITEARKKMKPQSIRMAKLTKFGLSLKMKVKTFMMGGIMSFLLFIAGFIGLLVLIKLLWPSIKKSIGPMKKQIMLAADMVWEGVKDLWTGLSLIWNSLFGGGSMSDLFKGIWMIAWGLIQILWGVFVGFWTTLSAFAKTAFFDLLARGEKWIEDLKGNYKKIIPIAIGLIAMLVALWYGAAPLLIIGIGVLIWAAVTALGEKLKGFVDKINPVNKMKEAVSFNLPKMASGGVSDGGITLVGERGPELVNLSKGSRVHSNAESKKMMGNTVQNFNITINAKDTSDAELRRVAEKISKMVSLKMNRTVSTMM